MKAGPSVVIHAADRFSGKNFNVVTPLVEDTMRFYLMQRYAALNACLAMCFCAEIISASLLASFVKTGSSGGNGS